MVTDHHAPRADGALPDAPIVHPAVCGYPCPELCATGVAYKLAGALLRAGGEDPAGADEDLDLVALATVADVVPLVDENRRLVRAGLRALAATSKPGLRALMRVAKTDPGGLGAHAIGFRLAPRINAVGRLGRADAALELVLTDDAERAAEVADELDHANAERRLVETRILFAAEAQAREAGERTAYVLAGEDWHPGVVGIVAARIAERHHRPTVLVAMDGARGTGSGRSIPAFDLLAGLHAGAEHLERHGGHRAAAGLEIRADALDAFRAAFEAHAAAVLAPEDLVPLERVDAVVPGDVLGLGLAEELERIEPCGAGNPGATLLVRGGHVLGPGGDGGGQARALLGHRGRRAVARGGVRKRRAAAGAGRRARRRDLPPGVQRVGRDDGAATGAAQRPAVRAGADRGARARRSRRGRAGGAAATRPATAPPGRARWWTAAGPASPASWPTSWPRASPCSSSSPTRRAACPGCGSASAASRSPRTSRSSGRRSWPHAPPTSCSSTRPRTYGRRARPAAATSISPTAHPRSRSRVRRTPARGTCARPRWRCTGRCATGSRTPSRRTR